VKGTIPAYAAGVLFRTSLGPREIQTQTNTTYRTSHWFDSLSLVHRFHIHAPDGEHPAPRVTHSCRSTSDGVIARIEKTGVRGGFTFGAKYDPCLSFFQKLQSVFRPASHSEPDEMCCSVTISADFPGLSRTGKKIEGSHSGTGITTLCNKTDSTMLQMLDPETLEPLGLASQKVLHPLLKGPTSAAHAETDPVTGDVFNFNLDFGRNGIYRVFTVSAASGKTSILATIHHTPAYLHSLLLTEHYVILCVWNSFFAAGGLSILWMKNYVDALTDYDDTRPATWFVIDRTPPEEGGRGLIAKYESDPFFCFHTINAYEEASSTDPSQIDIIADLTAYENLDCIKRFYLENLVSNAPNAKAYSDPSYSKCRPELRRFCLPNVSNVKTTSKAPKAITIFTEANYNSPELPTFNPAVKSHKHRFVYGVTDTGKASFFDGIIKYDVQNRTDIRWSVFGHTAGEPIFIADPGRPDEEDAGVLLVVVLDGFESTSYLLVLDAKDLTEVARADVGRVVGFGFHGTHVSTD
jgi:torulene dioxygenase